MSAFDNPSYLLEAVKILRGEPNGELSRNGKYRWGTHGSLSVDGPKWYDHEAQKGGRVVQFVQHELGLDAVRARMWLEQNAGFPGLPPKSPVFGRGLGEPSAVYTYRDEDGVVLFRVGRFDLPGGKKTFRQCRPNCSGWINNMEGVRRVPYRLDELQAALAGPRTIWIVEGEKCADALWNIDLPATCNPMGAGKWTDECTRALIGAHVVVIPDNDKTGGEHAQSVARALYGHAAAIRVLDLPGIGPKGDVFDWLSAGGTREALIKLATAAPEWTPPTNGHDAGAAPGAEGRTNGGGGNGADKQRRDGDTLTEWPDKTKAGAPRASYRNARLAVHMLHDLAFSHDLFADRLIVSGLSPEPQTLSDAACSEIRQRIVTEFEFDPGKEHVFDAVVQLCRENPFNPVLAYLDGLKWDGTERLSHWLCDYLGADETALNHAYARLTLIGAVRRARRPGCKFDTILVLQGEQGGGKSTAVRVLAGHDSLFSDQDLLHGAGREQQELLAGIWLYEIAELAGMQRAEIEKVKAFASRTHDRARPAYGRFSVDQPRKCIFIATTNQDVYLRDPTGNRRFLCVSTGVSRAIDIDGLEAARDQIWAEAAHCEAIGESAVLDAALWPEAAASQEARREEDPWTDILANVRRSDISPCGEFERLTSADLMDALEIPKERRTWVTGKRINDIMVGLGWRRAEKPFWINGKTVKGYIKPVRQVMEGNENDV